MPTWWPRPGCSRRCVDAARDGVDVRLLVPGIERHPAGPEPHPHRLPRLLRAGVRIFEWDGPMLHAKTMVADGRWARIGSSNINPSSLLGNYELDVLIEDVAFAHEMESLFRRDLDQSLEVERRVRGRGRLQQCSPPISSADAPARFPRVRPVHRASFEGGRRWPRGR